MEENKPSLSNLLTGGKPITVLHELDLASVGYLLALLVLFLVAQRVISK